MSTDKGYIKLYRDIRDHEIWQDEPFSMGNAWIDLIMMANHETKKILFNGKNIIVQRGSFITSIKKLSLSWGWSRHKVSDFLNLLESEKMIKQKRDNKKTTITIVNYGVYQGSERQSRTSQGHQKDITGTSQGHKQYTKKNEEDTKKKINTQADDETDWDEADYDYDGNGWK